MRISRVCAWGTSSLAYDGSGSVMLVSLLSSGRIVDRQSTPLKGVIRTLYPLGRMFALEARDFNHVRLHGSAEFCRLAGEYAGIHVKHMLFQELQEVEKYDGIWVCASILHVQKMELPEILQKMCTAAKSNGIIYIFFKYGDFEGERNGRYFTDLTEESVSELLKDVQELRIEKTWITSDVRAGRGDEKWLNMILRK